MNKAQEATRELIKASSNAPKLLKLEEKGFDQVSILVKEPVTVPGIGIAGTRRNAEISAIGYEIFSKIPLTVGFIC